jgi:hypothetical protein
VSVIRFRECMEFFIPCSRELSDEFPPEPCQMSLSPTHSKVPGIETLFRGRRDAVNKNWPTVQPEGLAPKTWFPTTSRSIPHWLLTVFWPFRLAPQERHCKEWGRMANTDVRR